uniref:Uncharacterized protein n=1 Tax=Musa acuminata subsp. malaccensis TaxID=214687 RepID=A0A804IZQ9_MUSAM
MAVVAIREYDAERDRVGAEAVERMCEVGHSGGAMSLFTDLLGDPLCRVRHSPPFLMLVAELVSGPEREIVGLVRGCIKTVACGTPLLLPSPAKHHTATAVPIYAKVAYLLGLRVSPAHRSGSRRRGRSTRTWRRRRTTRRLSASSPGGAVTPSSATRPFWCTPCSPTAFPSPHASPSSASRPPMPRPYTAAASPPPSSSPATSTPSWPTRSPSAASSPSPRAAPPRPGGRGPARSWPTRPPRGRWPACGTQRRCSGSRCGGQGGGGGGWRGRAGRWTGRCRGCASRRCRTCSGRSGCTCSTGWAGRAPRQRRTCGRCAGMCTTWRGRTRAAGWWRRRWRRASRSGEGIPHWGRLSCAEDVWCVKRLAEEYSDGSLGDWTKALSPPSIFVDPREF